MSMEIIAIQWMIDGWKMKCWTLVLFGVLLITFDTVTDCMGFQT